MTMMHASDHRLIEVSENSGNGKTIVSRLNICQSYSTLFTFVSTHASAPK